METPSFSGQLARHDRALTATERRVTGYLLHNRETALTASAVDLARAAGTSDATVIRAARKLGFAGLDALRKGLAGDLRRDLSLADRVRNTLSGNDGTATSGPGQTIAALRLALEDIEALSQDDYDAAWQILCMAPRIRIFGIGPSGFLAGYFAAQLGRMGARAVALRQTGLLFADELRGLERGDAVVALAYDRPYPEITALFDRAEDLGLPSVLITSPGPVLPDYRANITLRVARGQRDGISLHSATLALIEALLISYAAGKGDEARASLDTLNEMRARLSGRAMDL